MQPEPTNVQQRVLSQETAFTPATTSQHGQHCDDALQASLHPHSGELRGASGPPTGGNVHYAMRPRTDSDHGNTTEADGLKGIGVMTTSGNRIAEYENASASSARKPTEAPLFEVIKSNRGPEDKSSSIAKLPNGQCKPMEQIAFKHFRTVY